MLSHKTRARNPRILKTPSPRNRNDKKSLENAYKRVEGVDQNAAAELFSYFKDLKITCSEMNILLKYLSEIHVPGAMNFREIYRYEYFTAMVMQKIEQKNHSSENHSSENHFSFRNVHVLSKHQIQDFDDALLKAPIDLSIIDSIRKEPEEIYTVFCFTYRESSYCLAIKRNKKSASYEKYKVYKQDKDKDLGTENHSAPVSGHQIDNQVVAEISSSQDNAEQNGIDDLISQVFDGSDLIYFNQI